ncbi:MAG: hypothetical protein L6Q76_25640 [Polyangiaceae bacterium]|nr:hypothetical protein [Polyangiaceae bacterium]
MQTCSGCGASILVFGDADAAVLCRSCRVEDRPSRAPTRPFQNVGARRGRRLLGVRTAGLLVALAVVVATVMSLRDRPTDPASNAAPVKTRERIQLGGHTVEIFVAPPPKGAAGKE